MDSMGLDIAVSESSSPADSTSTIHQHQPTTQQKRNASEAGLKPNGMRPTKSVKRRASKACQCCRARKVRCNVVEHGAPCTNCRLDEVECIVSESKRKKYVSCSSIANKLILIISIGNGAMDLKWPQARVNRSRHQQLFQCPQLHRMSR